MEQDDLMLDLSAIQIMADPQSYSRGESYYHSNYVIKVKALSQNEIQGKVRGNYRPVYKVELKVDSKGQLFGTCTCPVSFDCKHCVAVALYYLHNSSVHYKESNQINNNNKNALDVENIVSNLSSELQARDLEIFSSPSGEFVKKLSTDELRRFFILSWSNNNSEKILPFTTFEFPYFRWESYLNKLLYQDNGINKDINGNLNKIMSSHKLNKNKFNEKEFIKKFGESPLVIIQLFQDKNIIVELLKIWFVGYIATIKKIHECFNLRGLLSEDRDILDDFYREIEFDSLKAEYEDNEDDFYYEYGEDEDEIYDELELGDHEFHTYLNNFFGSLIPVVEEVIKYIQLLQDFNLETFFDHFLEQEIQWLFQVDPTGLALNPRMMENWGFLTSLLKSKLQKISLSTKSPEKQVEYYIKLLSDNPTKTVGSLITEECSKFALQSETNIISLYIEKLEDLFQKQPLYEIYEVWFSTVQEYVKDNVQATLNKGLIESSRVSSFNKFISLITSEIQNLNVKNVLEKSNKTSQTNLLNLLISSIKNAPTKIKKSWEYNNLVEKTYTSLISWLENANLFKKSFDLLEEFILDYPKLITLAHYKQILKIKSRIEKETLLEIVKSNINYDSDILDKISNIEINLLKKGIPKEIVKIMLEKGDINNAAIKVIEVYNEKIQRDLIFKIANSSQAKLIPSTSISKMKKCLYSYINQWVLKRSSSRPDNIIAETILILKKFSEVNNDPKLKQDYNAWFKQFQKKHNRLRNLKTAMNKKGLNF